MNLHPTMDLFRPYLLPGERILWIGQPKQGILFRGGDAYLVPVSLIWGGFAIIWNALVWFAPFDWSGSGSPDWFFRLFGLPFLVAGLYLIFGRFLHDASIRKHLHYAVTDQRALILRGHRSPKLTSLDLRRLPRLELSEHRDGTGTLVFESDSIFWRMNSFTAWVPALRSSAQFFRIDNPRKVYELIRDNSPF